MKYFLILFSLFVLLQSCKTSKYSHYREFNYVTNTDTCFYLNSKIRINNISNTVKVKIGDSTYKYDILESKYFYPRYTLFKRKSSRSGVNMICTDSTKITYHFKYSNTFILFSDSSGRKKGITLNNEHY